jgi:hypothetical protein
MAASVVTVSFGEGKKCHEFLLDYGEVSQRDRGKSYHLSLEGLCQPCLQRDFLYALFAEEGVAERAYPEILKQLDLNSLNPRLAKNPLVKKILSHVALPSNANEDQMERSAALQKTLTRLEKDDKFAFLVVKKIRGELKKSADTIFWSASRLWGREYRPLKDMFQVPKNPLQRHEERDEVHLDAFSAQKSSLYCAHVPGSFVKAQSRLVVPAGEIPNYADLIAGLCGIASKDQVRKLSHINRFFALVDIQDHVLDQDRSKIEKEIFRQKSETQSKFMRGFVDLALGSAIILPVLSQLSFELWPNKLESLIMTVGAFFYSKALFNFLRLYFESENQQFKVCEQLRTRHKDDRQSLLTVALQKFVDCYCDPCRWDELIGSTASSLLYKDLFGRPDGDQNLPWTQANGGEYRPQSEDEWPRVTVQRIADGGADDRPYFMDTEEQQEVVQQQLPEILCLTHMEVADTALKQLFSVSVAYSFARRKGLIDKNRRPDQELLEQLMKSAQSEKCDKGGTYERLNQAFKEMLDTFGISAGEWEYLAPAVIAIERSYREKELAESRRIVQDQVLGAVEALGDDKSSVSR